MVPWRCGKSTRSYTSRSLLHSSSSHSTALSVSAFTSAKGQGWADAFKWQLLVWALISVWTCHLPLSDFILFWVLFFQTSLTKCKMKRGINRMAQSYFMEKKVRAQRGKDHSQTQWQSESGPCLLPSPGSHSMSFFSFKFLEHFADSGQGLGHNECLACLLSRSTFCNTAVSRGQWCAVSTLRSKVYPEFRHPLF